VTTTTRDGVLPAPRRRGVATWLRNPWRKPRILLGVTMLYVAWSLLPAIFASTVLVFADVIDDFVIVRYLSGGSSTEPVSVKIYNTARAAPTPALNALATVLLLSSFLVVLLGFAAYRHFTRGEQRSIDVFAGEA
jgi:spermidine/putrescine transport system permease protein